MTCYVKDFYPKEVFVSWLVDDEPLPAKYNYSTSQPIKNGQNFSAYSQLTVDYYEWKNGDATIELSVISSVGQSSSDSQKLLCSVTGFDPKIKWLSQSIEKTGRDPDVTVMEDGRVKVYSEILVPQQEWTQGVTYTCQATSRHSGKTADKSTSVCTGYIKKDPVVVIRRTLMKSAQADSAVLECVVNDLPSGESPEPENGFALDCNKVVLEEDEFRSLWSTATSFIFLFLFSLTYSAVLSFCKVKH
ncbi:immunoglobulin heavy chain [Labeo rohita]|nr:immunoglobulin heavy chain [Labeo rohita]